MARTLSINLFPLFCAGQAVGVGQSLTTKAAMQSFDKNNDLLNIHFFNELKPNFVQPKQQHDRYFNCFKSRRGQRRTEVFMKKLKLGGLTLYSIR